MMCFSTAITSITPVTVLAKCAHKHTQWVKLVNTTCTKDGKTVYVCNDCNKTLKVVKTRHYGHKFVNYYVAPTCKKGLHKMQKTASFRKGWKTAWTLLALMEEKSHYRKSK